MLYDKGPVLLQDLEDRIGRAKFRSLLSRVYLAGVSSTEQFLSLLETSADRGTMEYFSKLLDE